MKFIKFTMCALLISVAAAACHGNSGKSDAKTDSAGMAAPTPGPDAMPAPVDSVAPVPVTPDSQNAANTEAANAATEAEKKMDGNKK